MWWGIQRMLGLMFLRSWNQWTLYPSFQKLLSRKSESVPDVPSQKDMEGRLDLRDEITFTIDGADAKDLDDAVHIKALKKWQYRTRSSHSRCFLLCY